MQGTQARTNFIYADPNTYFHSLLTPFDVQTLFAPQFIQPSSIPKQPISQINQEINGLSRELVMIPSTVLSDHSTNDNTSRETCSSYESILSSSVPDNHEINHDLIFSSSSDSSSNSGYLGCIVPESCLRPPPDHSSPKKREQSFSPNFNGDDHHHNNVFLPDEMMGGCGFDLPFDDQYLGCGFESGSE